MGRFGGARARLRLATPTSSTSTGRRKPMPRSRAAPALTHRARARAAQRGRATSVRPRRRPPSRGPERRRRPLARRLPRLLRALVAHLGGAGAAAGTRGRGRRRAHRAIHRARRRGALPRARSPSSDVREVKRIKARVENERLPQGADPTRHLKLGRGSLSDVEWFVQLLQLQHAAAVPALRTHVDARRAGGGRRARARRSHPTPRRCAPRGCSRLAPDRR